MCGNVILLCSSVFAPISSRENKISAYSWKEDGLHFYLAWVSCFIVLLIASVLEWKSLWIYSVTVWFFVDITVYDMPLLALADCKTCAMQVGI